MRIGNLILAAIVLSPATFAQNEIEIWPGATQFTSRGSIGNNATGGDILQGLHTTAFTGLGDNGVIARVDAFRMILQDQNTDTQENYNIVYRSGSDTAGPDTGNAGIICSLGPFTSFPRGGGGMIQAMNIVHNFGTAHCLELCDFNAFGINFHAPPPGRWTRDGISVHMSRGDGTNARTVQRAAPNATTSDMAWQVIDTGSGENETNPSLHRSWRFRFITDTGTLQMGNGGTRYGQGGPNPATDVPFSARARYGSSSGVDDSWLFLSIGKMCPGISIEPGMRVYLDPSTLVGPFVIAGIPASGQAIHDLGTTPATSPGVTMHFQAIGIIRTPRHCILTNLCTSEL